jgi:hypothetical protein
MTRCRDEAGSARTTQATLWACVSEQRFSARLADYRAGTRATPEAWRQPGTRLAQELAAPAGRPGRRGPEDDHVRFEAALQR